MFGGDEVKLRVEASAVVNEVLYAVKEAYVSRTLPIHDDLAYINLQTKEGERYCVELSIAGFRVAGREFDQMEIQDGQQFETVYSLLDALSPSYRLSFGTALANRLEELKSQPE